MPRGVVVTRRLSGHHGIVGTSALLFVGIAAARALGLAFQVVAARLLHPGAYGLLAYALAVGNVTIVLVNNAPNALATYLSIHRGAEERERYFTNSVAFVALMVAISLVAIVPIALATGLLGTMLPGLVANLVGIAVYATYREAQRGQGNFLPMAVFYVLANLVQLVAIVVLGALNLRSAPLFLFVYGVSNIVALLIMQSLRPVGLRLRRDLVSRSRLRVIAEFTWPLCAQAAFWSIWFGADLVIVRWLLPSAAGGQYAAAKTLANVLLMVPLAIGSVLVPRMAGRDAAGLRHQLQRVLLVTAGLMLPLAGGLVVFRRPIIAIAFGPGYAPASRPLVWLAAAMFIDSAYLVLEGTWSAMGRTRVLPVATGLAMTTTVLAALVLVPHLGLEGAAVAFAAGAAARLLWIGRATLREFA